MQLRSGEVDISVNTSDLNPSNYIDHDDADLPYSNLPMKEKQAGIKNSSLSKTSKSGGIVGQNTRGYAIDNFPE